MYEALSTYAPLEELQHLLEGVFGLTSRDILNRVKKHFGLCVPDSLSREVHQCSEEIIAQVQPTPGAREALLALDLLVTVTPNSRRRSLEHSLARVGLSEPIGERLTSVDMVALSKPVPDVYLHAANLLGTIPECYLVVEDSSTGTRATPATGMWVIGLAGVGHILAGYAGVLCGLGAIVIVEHMREPPETMARPRRESRVVLGTPQSDVRDSPRLGAPAGRIPVGDNSAACTGRANRMPCCARFPSGGRARGRRSSAETSGRRP